MKKIIFTVISAFVTLTLFAGTPAEEVVEKYKEMKGARNLVAKGVLIKMARPLMKDYQIAPLAHKVEELSVLRIDKAEPVIREQFLKDLQIVLDQYMYAGQSVTRNGIVDAYVHLARPDVADELIVYNPKIYALYSVSGTFTAEELMKIQKKP
ncbi:MAG: hypothetical protein E7116_08915 [Bacteroidales bacterium]|nr:hypothetical protein [Bacteroidales bacterium]